MTIEELGAAYQNARPVLVRFLVQKMSLEEAEDTAQDAAVQMLKTADSHPFRGDCKFSTWLTTIAVRCWLMKRRRALANPSLYVSIEDYDAPVASAADNRVYLAEAEALLRSSVASGQAGILSMFAVGYTIKEIAAIRRVSLGCVKSQLFKGREKLKCLVSSPTSTN